MEHIKTKTIIIFLLLFLNACEKCKGRQAVFYSDSCIDGGAFILGNFSNQDINIYPNFFYYKQDIRYEKEINSKIFLPSNSSVRFFISLKQSQNENLFLEIRGMKNCIIRKIDLKNDLTENVKIEDLEHLKKNKIVLIYWDFMTRNTYQYLLDENQISCP